jgi:hypothetical protein
MKLRTFLLAVVGLTLVPLVGVAGVAIWWAHQDEPRAMEQAPRFLTVTVDREASPQVSRTLSPLGRGQGEGPK